MVDLKLLMQPLKESAVWERLSVRAQNALLNNLEPLIDDTVRVLDLVIARRKVLARFPNFGKGSLQKVAEACEAVGLRLEMEPPEIHTCRYCRKKFLAAQDLEAHVGAHLVRQIKKEPLCYVLHLPQHAALPDRFAAAEVFADARAVLRRAHPETAFQFLPLSYAVGKDGAQVLSSMLAMT